MAKPGDERQKDLFRPAWDQIISMEHPLMKRAGQIGWVFIGKPFGCASHQGPEKP